jgi:hypothetical protein
VRHHRSAHVGELNGQYLKVTTFHGPRTGMSAPTKEPPTWEASLFDGVFHRDSEWMRQRGEIARYGIALAQRFKGEAEGTDEPDEPEVACRPFA